MKKISLTACLLVILMALPSWALAKPISVYYMPDTDQLEITCHCVTCQDGAIINALSPFYSVTRGVQFREFDGSQDLSGYDVVVFTNTINYTLDMPESGQIALKDFVIRGGGLITGEWVLWAAAEMNPLHLFSTLKSIFPGSGDYWGVEPFVDGTYTQATPNKVLNYNVPITFTFPLERQDSPWAGYEYETETKISAKPGAQTYYNSANYPGAGLVGWSYGNGRVLNFSTCIAPEELSDRNYKQLFVNSVAWAAGQPGFPQRKSRVRSFPVKGLKKLRPSSGP